MTDEEIDEACNFVLTNLGELYPRLSKELTKITNGPRYKKHSKHSKKIEKVKLLYEKHIVVFEEIYAPLNAEWARESRSPANFFYLLERRLTKLNPYGERTGGNYTAKA